MTAPAAASVPLSRLLITAAAAIAILAGIRISAPILGPVMIALVITIAWSPGSDWLRRRGWPPSVAALTGIMIGVVGIGLFVLLVWSSLIQLQDKLPGYQPRIEALQQLIRDKLADLPIESSRLFTGEVLNARAIVGYALKLISNLTQTAGNLLILVLLMAFMMLEAIRYPEKLRHALGEHSVAVEQLMKFGESIKSYVVINSVFGLVAAAINTVLLLIVGVDFAFLWGVMSFLLSFVPNVGFLIALLPPTLLALVEFGFTRAIIVAGGYIIINFVVDNLIKPRFVGQSLDLSPLVVVLSLVFWGWLMGPLGALVAVPLSIGVKFFFDSFEESRWLAVLMSNSGPKAVLIPEPKPSRNQPAS
jgi:AI-2 transport protein TqsA